MFRKNRKQERNRKIMGVIVIVVMLFSIVGFLFGSYGGGTSEDLRYGRFTFTQTPNGYVTEINEEEQLFTFLPDHVADIPASVALQQALKAPSLKITYDETGNRTQELATLQYYLEQDLTATKVYVERGTTTGESLPAITCADATAFVPVILLSQGDALQFIEENNCFTIQTGSSYDLVRVFDRLRYLIHGVPS
jgi:hypothetical protein